MHIRISNGGLYFPTEELELEIAERGNIILSSKEEIMDSLRKTTGFSVVGQLSIKIKEELVGIPGEIIYVVRLLPT